MKQQGDQRVLTAAYGEEIKGFEVFHDLNSFHFHYGGIIPEIDLAYETWGELNENKDNAIILHSALSASSHASSHSVSCVAYKMCTVMLSYLES